MIAILFRADGRVTSELVDASITSLALGDELLTGEDHVLRVDTHEVAIRVFAGAPKTPAEIRAALLGALGCPDLE